ncbi:MAG: hypothetical protein AAGE52_03310 [Myxococcota bacterium]
MNVDKDAAFESYKARFISACGDKAVGSFAKFGNHMVQRLNRSQFDERLESYIKWHAECRNLLGSGATISDVLVMEFDEAAAWLIIRAPNVLEMFSGEIGDPEHILKKPEAQ